MTIHHNFLVFHTQHKFQRWVALLEKSTSEKIDKINCSDLSFLTIFVFILLKGAQILTLHIFGTYFYFLHVILMHLILWIDLCWNLAVVCWQISSVSYHFRDKFTRIQQNILFFLQFECIIVFFGCQQRKWENKI